MAIKGRRAVNQPPIILRPIGIPGQPVGKQLSPIGQAASQAAAAYARRTIRKVILRQQILGAAPSTIVFVQGTSAAFGNSASARSLAFVSNLQPHDLIEVTVATFNPGITLALTDTLSQTYQQAGNYVSNGSSIISKWYVPNTLGGADTITVTPSGLAYMTIAIAEYSGIAPVNPFNSWSLGNTGNSSSPSTGITAVATPGDLVVGAYCQGTAALGSDSVASPFNKRADQLNGTTLEGLGTADDLAAAGSEGATFTTSTSVLWAAIAVSYKAGSFVPGGPAPGVQRPNGQASALAAAQFYRRPVFKAKIFTVGSPAPVAVIQEAGRLASQQASIIAHRMPVHPNLKVLGPPPAIGKHVEATGGQASREATNYFHRPLFRPIVKKVPHFAIINTFKSAASQAAAIRRYHDVIGGALGQTTFTPPGGPPDQGIRYFGRFASQQAAAYYRRVTRMLIKKLGAPKGKGATLSPNRQAINAATRIRFFTFHAGINHLLSYGPPVNTAQTGAIVAYGRLASQAAVQFMHRPLFRPIVQTPGFALEPPPLPIPIWPGATLAPLLNRTPAVEDQRLRRFTELISEMYNSLVKRGYIRKTSETQWAIQTGPFQGTRPPGINDDVTIDAVVGSFWVDTITDVVYVCVSNVQAKARWKQIT
jgi:hypothetical protein